MADVDLTWDERVYLAHNVSQFLTEHNTDELLDLMESRLKELADDRMPRWMKALVALPLVPHPATVIRNRLDGYMPEAIRDPLIELIRGKTNGQG